MIPPRSFVSSVYCASPSPILSRSFERLPWSSSRALGPRPRSRPCARRRRRRSRSHGAVLRDHALVLHRHLPAGEGHHARTRGDVALVERRAQERLHAATLTLSTQSRIRSREPETLEPPKRRPPSRPRTSCSRADLRGRSGARVACTAGGRARAPLGTSRTVGWVLIATRLGHGDLDAALSLVSEAAATNGLRPFEQHTIEDLLGVIPADRAGYFEYVAVSATNGSDDVPRRCARRLSSRLGFGRRPGDHRLVAAA